MIKKKKAVSKKKSTSKKRQPRDIPRAGGKKPYGCITDIAGIKVGHAQSEEGGTGCTVVLFEKGGIAGVDIGGSAPGTRETEMLNPTNMIVQIHSILLTGGTTFGLRAASGVQHYLQERDIGFHASTGVVVPIVPTACIFDLDVGKPRIYPGRTMGIDACESAGTKASPQGSVGVGIGARCGKVLGTEHSMRGGLGTASMLLPGGIRVGALAVCNSWGDVVNPRTGRIIAGAVFPQTSKSKTKSSRKREFVNTEQYISETMNISTRFFGMNTTLCVVATNAALTREQTTKVAAMAQDGIARVTRPSHTLFDGDVVFAVSTGKKKADLNIIGSVAARMVSSAIMQGVCHANALKVPNIKVSV